MGIETRFASLAGITVPRSAARAADHRVEARERHHGRAATAVRYRGAHHIVQLLDRSSDGVSVALPRAPRIGERIAVTMSPGRSRSGTICWFRAGRAGISLD